MGISVSIVRAIVHELSRYGIALEQLFEEIGVDPGVVRNSTGRLSIDESRKLVGKAIELTEMPDLGLRLGATAPIGALQLLGPMLESAPSVRQAVALYQRYGALLVDGSKIELIEGSPYSSIRYLAHSMSRGGMLARFAAEAAIVFMSRIGIALLGPASSPRVARFQHARPDCDAAYRAVLGCDVEFGCRANELVFDSSFLDTPSLNLDEALCALLETRADGLLSSLTEATTLEQRVADLLALEVELSELDVNVVAARLGLGARTLQRRLGEEGSSWSSILEAEQKKRACSALSDTSMPIKELAFHVGFSEPSAFHRAFKRWTGTTPNEFRRTRRASRPPTAS
ncbi:MAG: AraC family transcriptional regulator [Polyangiaceae bacterium]|nr:AraC family transcriptional regulator [Polyangiaceae bacterium]